MLNVSNEQPISLFTMSFYYTFSAQKIQISQDTRDILAKTKTFVLEKRGDVDVKVVYW